MIAGAKKALHRNKHQNESRNDTSQNNHASLDQAPSQQTAVFKFSIGPELPDGYTCWDKHNATSAAVS
jgi:hypothetical protein